MKETKNTQDNNDLEDLLSKSFRSMNARSIKASPQADTFVMDVMHRISETQQECVPASEAMDAPRLSVSRTAVLALGLMLGVTIAWPAFVHVTDWLSQLSTVASGLPEVGAVRAEVLQWLNSRTTDTSALSQMDLSVFATIFGAIAISALVLFPALEE